MKIPMSWLKTFADLPDMDIKTFTDHMTMSGSKVEGCEIIGGGISGVVTGKVLSIIRHPGADKLFVTMVDVGQSAPLQIVTGAVNVKAGDFVPVALDGAVLAGGKQIQTGEIRGQQSAGMLCSINELGFDRDDCPEAPEDGIYIFTEPVPLGADPLALLDLRETVVDFELTSNRPDCFSVIGMAREAAAAFGKTLNVPDITVTEAADSDVKDFISVNILNPKLCPRYCARVVTDVTIAPSPLWIRRRLSAAGLRPVNNIVDVTNYVMLEMGQPMHAFDISGVRGGEIIVRNARENEVITTLDKVTRTLDPSMLVIADRERAIAVAGVMGGEESKITGNADAVLLESACFDGVSVRLTAKKLGLRTDSSSKFEKQLDPNMALAAVNRAAELIEAIGAGRIVRNVADEYPAVRKPWQVVYSVERINGLLGVVLTDDEVTNLLATIGVFAKNGVADIPTYRPDLTEEADIAEEVARLYGYDRLPATLASGTPTIGKKTDAQLRRDIIKNSMAALGYNECLTYAFESPKVFNKLTLAPNHKLREAAVIKNPLGEDYSIMRTTTVSSMLENLATNHSRHDEETALYELARVYIPFESPLKTLPRELDGLTMGVSGNRNFFDVKGAVLYICEGLGIPEEVVLFHKEPASANVSQQQDVPLPFLHPGRMAYISINGVYAGFMGEVHPAAAENFAAPERSVICVLYTEALFENGGQPVYKPLPRFPGIKRDIAVVLDGVIPAAGVTEAIRANGGPWLAEVQLFDAYQGSHIEDGKRSLAFGLTFRHPQRTLADQEAADAVKDIVAVLNQTFGAVLRS